jgi:hypothetical protein
MVGLPVDEDGLLAKYRIVQGVEENYKSVKLLAKAI